MRTIIITEGGKNIGLGHITRCIGLYQAFKKKDAKVIFMASADIEARQFLKSQGIRSIMPYSKNKLFSIIENFDIAVVDSYILPKRIYGRIAKTVKLAIYIDDFKRLNYPCGIILNANPDAKALDYPNINGREYLLGNHFCLLRKDFWYAHRKRIKKEVKNILITLGGSDHSNIIGKILKIVDIFFNKVEITVLVGLNFNKLKQIKLMVNNFSNKNKIKVVSYSNRIKNFMQKVDLCISGGGQTINELMRLGIPTVCICFAENQRLNLLNYKKYGALEFIDSYKQKELKKRLPYLLKKISNFTVRKRMAKIARQLVDGRGAERTAERIYKYVKN